jgi:hypothetical protein
VKKFCAVRPQLTVTFNDGTASRSFKAADCAQPSKGAIIETSGGSSMVPDDAKADRRINGEMLMPLIAALATKNIERRESFSARTHGIGNSKFRGTIRLTVTRLGMDELVDFCD